MARNWTREILRFATALVVAAIALVFCVGAARAVELFLSQAPSTIPRSVIRQTVLPSGLGYELRWNGLPGGECYSFPVSTPQMSGWIVVDKCPDDTQQGGAPYYGDVTITVPAIMRVDALRLWPLDFMPGSDACPGPWQDTGVDATSNGANVGVLFFVRSTGRLYLCTQAGLRVVAVD